jgi:hypothetical protein
MPMQALESYKFGAMLVRCRNLRHAAWRHIAMSRPILNNVIEMRFASCIIAVGEAFSWTVSSMR